MNVEIIECTDPTELYYRYDRQLQAQPAYIELDLPQGILVADYDADLGGTSPGSVHHGFERRYSIPVLTGEAANRVMREIAPLADRILADWEEVCDERGNMLVRLGDDAQAAEAEIEEHLGLTLGHGALGGKTRGFRHQDWVAEWELHSAVNGEESEFYGITAETTDERLDEIHAAITHGLAQAGESTIAVVPGLDKHLRDLRRALTDQSA